MQKFVFVAAGFVFRFSKFLFEFGKFAVTQFRSLVKVIRPFGFVDFRSERFYLFSQFLHFVDIRLFVDEFCVHRGIFFSERSQLFSYVRKTLFGEFVRFFFERSFLDFEFHYLSRNVLHFGRHRVHFGFYHRAGFVHKVDSLIGQKSVRDISVG